MYADVRVHRVSGVTDDWAIIYLCIKRPITQQMFVTFLNYKYKGKSMQAFRYKKSQFLTDESKGDLSPTSYSAKCQKILEYVLKGNVDYILRIFLSRPIVIYE